MVLLEFGSGIPRSGGMKVYLERCFSPRLLVTCVYLFYCAILRGSPSLFFLSFWLLIWSLTTETSASNAITASSYILKAASVASTTWKLRGLAISAVSFAVGIHTVAPRVGRGLQDILSIVKLFTLFFIVCTGFAALGGHLRVPKPDNLSLSSSFRGTSSSGYNIGTALLDAIFSFQGYDNLNAVTTHTPF